MNMEDKISRFEEKFTPPLKSNTVDELNTGVENVTLQQISKIEGVKSFSDFVDYLINNILISTFFLDLYYYYANGLSFDSKGSKFINTEDRYTQYFHTIQLSKNLNWCHKVVNFTIYKFRRLLLLIIKTVCFVLDIITRVFSVIIIFTLLLGVAAILLNSVGIIEIRFLSCRAGLIRCASN